MRNVNNSIRASANQFFFRVYSISVNASALRWVAKRGRIICRNRSEYYPTERTFTERRDNEISTISLSLPSFHPTSSIARCNDDENDDGYVEVERNATLYTSLYRDCVCVHIGLWTPVRWCSMGEGRWARWSVGANIHYRFGGV